MRSIVVAALAPLLALPAVTAAAVPLRPPVSEVQCIAASVGCLHAQAVSSPSGVEASPDGRTAYVRSGVGSLGSLGVFARDGGGKRLTQIQCVARRARPCADGRGLETPAALAVSPDGRSAYVAAANGRSVGVYRRLAGGRLAPAGSVTGLAHPRSIAISPDGRNVYVGGDRLWTFARAASGALRLLRTDAGDANALVATRDGDFVYSAGGGGRHGSLVTWRRDSADGTLTRVGALCSLGDDCGNPGAGLLQPVALALSAGDSTLWVAATVSQGVTAYRRDPASGALTAGAQRRDLPATADVAVVGGTVFVAYRDGLAILPSDLLTRQTVALRRATGVIALMHAVYVVSAGRITAFAR